VINLDLWDGAGTQGQMRLHLDGSKNRKAYIKNALRSKIELRKRIK
jgi:hypothetical protein